MHDRLPASIIVEGPIGAGKTTLVRRLADHCGLHALLEQDRDNPFLPHFYQKNSRVALPTQLYFLFQRGRQLAAFRQRDLFHPPGWITDFMLEKDPLFAQATLDEQEYPLYLQVHQLLGLQPLVPELMIYLQAPPEVLLRRIRRRGIPYERQIDPLYLEQICTLYVEYFHHYKASPLIIVNVSECNLAGGEETFQRLLRYIGEGHRGRSYFNPGRSA